MRQLLTLKMPTSPVSTRTLSPVDDDVTTNELPVAESSISEALRLGSPASSAGVEGPSPTVTTRAPAAFAAFAMATLNGSSEFTTAVPPGLMDENRSAFEAA